METSLDCFLMVDEVNVGSEAIERDSIYGVPMTLINKDNPANASGKITSVEIYPSSTGDLANCEVATFYRPDSTGYPNKFTTRGTHTIGAVTGGSKQTETVNLTVEGGDYLGMTFTAGAIEYSSTGSGYDGVWSSTGDSIPCTNATFSFSLGATISLKATNAISGEYTDIDCDLLVDDKDADLFFGKTIDGDLNVTRDIVGACLDTSQSIRMTITIDGENVEDSLTGNITIAHNLNYISTFSLQLCDSKYSPLTDSHIAVNSIVIITVFINGQEMKMFTGLVDSTHTSYDGGYKLTIKGRDYGKKLLDKTMTLISVQNAAEKSYRGSMVKYLAKQADVTNINVPKGDAVTIDHSFQDQTIWDMIQKECAIEGWNVRHDKEGKTNLAVRAIKTTPDWEYGEDKFVQLGLETSDRGIINKLIILGAIFEEETITVEHDEIEQEVEVPTVEYQENTTNVNKSFVSGEAVTNWSYEDANFKVTAKYIGWTRQPGLPFNPYQDYQFTIVQLNNDLTVVDVTWAFTSNAHIYYERRNSCRIHRETFSIGGMNFQEGAFTITIAIKTKEKIAGGSVWITENIPIETTVSTITYNQIKASVEDTDSITLYGERKPNNEGTLEFPLAETETQCERIGENIILDSHRFIQQPDFLVNFNPKLIVGETVELTDKKIGYDGDNYFVEEVVHTINIDKKTGVMKPRTRIGCVYYA